MNSLVPRAVLMTCVLFWDIDGTLLTTKRAGIFAWEEAAREVAGQPVDFTELGTAGLTDVEIAVKILDRYQVAPSSENVRRLLHVYERYLPERLGWRAGCVLPGVREVLDYLQGRTDVLSLLLTGNTCAAAAAKLKHYGLDSYFSAGAFAEDGPDRPAVARRALALAQDMLGETIPGERLFVIGDTPHDVHCGKAIGAWTIAVASGNYCVADLLEYEPWRAFDRLPEPEEFARLLGLNELARHSQV